LVRKKKKRQCRNAGERKAHQIGGKSTCKKGTNSVKCVVLNEKGMEKPPYRQKTFARKKILRKPQGKAEKKRGRGS